MQRYPLNIIDQARELRKQGKTYREIRESLHINPTKSTLSYWFKHFQMGADYFEQLVLLNKEHLKVARQKALEANRIKKELFYKNLELINAPVAINIHNKNIAKIALAMLCLGEASKYNPKTSNSFYFGNSNPKIISIFLELLKSCFSYEKGKVRCTVLCRADQDVSRLENFWMDLTKIPKNQFYKTRIDPRTIGKPTLKTNYKGVLRVDYFDNKVRLELESLSELIFNELSKSGPVA